MRLLGRLFASHVALTAAGATVTAACALVSFHGYVVDSNRADLAARTDAIAANVADCLERGDRHGAERVTATHGAQEDIWIRILTPDGMLLASSSPVEDRLVADWRVVPGVVAALSGGSASGIARAIGAPDDRLYEARPLVRDGRMLGIVRVSRTLAGLRQQDLHTVATVFSALAVVLAMATLASLALARVLAAPIRRMRDFAAQIGEGKLGDVLTIRSRDEIGDLARSLNVMSQKLSLQDQERRTFLARASHELRTPVTNVQASLEALEGGAMNEPTLRSQFLGTALRETERMADLIRDLLDLGRLDAGVSAIEMRPVELQRVVQLAVQAFLVRLRLAQVTVQLQGPELPRISGDSDRLQRAVINVLDNALRHSPPRSAIVVDLELRTDHVVVVVSDQGRGFLAADLPRIFQQFYSGGDSRAGRGTGLGLAIASRIVEAHGGTMVAENGPAGGARISIALPVIRS